MITSHIRKSARNNFQECLKKNQEFSRAFGPLIILMKFSYITSSSGFDVFIIINSKEIDIQVFTIKSIILLTQTPSLFATSLEIFILISNNYIHCPWPGQPIYPTVSVPDVLSDWHSGAHFCCVAVGPLFPDRVRARVCFSSFWVSSIASI